MSTGVLDSPKSNVEALESAEIALWNPNAAANWSLVLTPAFGPYLHMKNWQALGEERRARGSRIWFIVAVILLAIGIVGAVVLPPVSGLARIASFVLLICWYFVSARPQASYVKDYVGDDYPRKGWLVPIFVALAILVGTAFVLGYGIALLTAILG